MLVSGLCILYFTQVMTLWDSQRGPFFSLATWCRGTCSEASAARCPV
jgi:hypothetical protein